MSGKCSFRTTLLLINEEFETVYNCVLNSYLSLEVKTNNLFCHEASILMIHSCQKPSRPNRCSIHVNIVTLLQAHYLCDTIYTSIHFRPTLCC